MKKKKKSYIRLFSIPEIANRALSMLSENPPCSYTEIAEKLNCDRSSVIYFHKKKIREGLTLENFNGVKIEILGGLKKEKPEILNLGKNYKDYLKKYVKERDKLNSKRMKDAKKTIDKLRKNRIKEGIDFDFEVWDF